MKLVPLLLLFVLILSVWLLPSATFALGIAFVLVSLSLAVFLIFRKHQTAYLQGRITHVIFVRNTLLDVVGVLLTVGLAVLLARYVAGLVINPMSNGLARQVAGIVLGLLVGIGMGILVNRLWARFVSLRLRGKP